MGYDLHITRSSAPDGGGPRIGADEWRALVETDAELRLHDGITAALPGGHVLTIPSPDLAAWSGHPQHAEVPFRFHDGRVTVRNPDEAVLAKMIDLAGALDARVQGDDGEFYPPTPA
ncbi:hypothetical protein [Promicromonospora sp. NPDC090134]|uniref:hypothetical protein n=1 Tax=Promicromonospora sp. NPDC090134 TaxID=3364408 RepID=UPI00381A75C5